jgi:mannan polymerase II complex MNN10 subunit
MLLRSVRRIPPSLLLLVLFLAFFGWQLSQGTKHEDGPIGHEVILQDENEAFGEKRTPRIALMTFVTEQRSYLHLSLKNKDRK